MPSTTMTITGPAVVEGSITDAPTHVWGFGSLLHNPGFEYDERVNGYIKGYRRVFHQGSTDHRGVPGAPGRTVTLEPCADAVTWGAAFKLAGDSEQRQRTLQYLEWREKQYDVRAHVEVYTAAGGDAAPVLTALTFIASPDRQRNPNYLGPAPLDDIAQQISSAAGPSGPNFEYLFRLADAMRAMSVADDQLFQLEAKVRARLQLAEAASTAAAAAAAGGGSSTSAAGQQAGLGSGV